MIKFEDLPHEIWLRYYTKAEYLIKRGFVSSNSIEELAKKIYVAGNK